VVICVTPAVAGCADAGLRDELLGIAVHPVRADVQSRLFLFWGDPEADRGLDGREDPVGEDEHEHERRRHADRLDGELAQRRAE
jgi:hypothetical protein